VTACVNETILPDTSAFLALREDEEGTGQVADILRMAQTENANCFACLLTLMEFLYRVCKDEGEHEVRMAYEQCQTLSVRWIHESRQLLEKAAEIKAKHGLSMADAWIGASAILNDSVLVHKDPEFEALDCAQLRLPYKGPSKK
jgi:predicted nucleic acid-binding protein